MDEINNTARTERISNIRTNWRESMMKTINLPFHKIHDYLGSYGFLICPIWKRDRDGGLKWIGYFKGYGFQLTGRFGFHNCTTTGIH